jgi:hypothetical protein
LPGAVRSHIHPSRTRGILPPSAVATVPSAVLRRSLFVILFDGIQLSGWFAIATVEPMGRLLYLETGLRGMTTDDPAMVKSAGQMFEHLRAEALAKRPARAGQPAIPPMARPIRYVKPAATAPSNS